MSLLFEIATVLKQLNLILVELFSMYINITIDRFRMPFSCNFLEAAEIPKNGVGRHSETV